MLRFLAKTRTRLVLYGSIIFLSGVLITLHINANSDLIGLSKIRFHESFSSLSAQPIKPSGNEHTEELSDTELINNQTLIPVVRPEEPAINETLEPIEYFVLGCFIDSLRGSPGTNQWKKSFRVISSEYCARKCLTQLYTATYLALYQVVTKRCLCQDWHNGKFQDEAACNQKQQAYQVLGASDPGRILAYRRQDVRCSCNGKDCHTITCNSVTWWRGPTFLDLKPYLSYNRTCPKNYYTIQPFYVIPAGRQSRVIYCLKSDGLRGFYPLPASTTEFIDTSLERLYTISKNRSLGPITVHMKPENKTKILLIGTYRSGSSLISELFSSHPKSLYIFEPFSSVGGMYDNFENAPPRSVQIASHYLNSLYSCNLYGFSSSTFDFFKQTPRISTGCKISDVSYIDCLATYWTRCMFQDITAVKTIRNNMKLVQYHLKIDQTLKVVFLSRDPRGLYFSLHKVGVNDLLKKIYIYCTNQIEDVKLLQELSAQYPNQISYLNYEDLILDSTAVANKVYSDLQLEVPNQVLSVLYNLTHGRQAHESMAQMKLPQFATFRKDSISSAFGWKRALDLKTVQMIDSMCSESYKYTGYTPIASEEQLHNIMLYHKINSGHLT